MDAFSARTYRHAIRFGQAGRLRHLRKPINHHAQQHCTMNNVLQNERCKSIRTLNFHMNEWMNLLTNTKCNKCSMCANKHCCSICRHSHNYLREIHSNSNESNARKHFIHKFTNKIRQHVISFLFYDGRSFVFLGYLQLTLCLSTRSQLKMQFFFLSAAPFFQPSRKHFWNRKCKRMEFLRICITFFGKMAPIQTAHIVLNAA